MIGAEDWAVFFDPADFATPANWETQAAESATLDGIFSEAAEVAAGVSASLPTFTAPETAIPTTAAQGDELEVQGETFLVSDIEPDGAGLVRVILERT